MIILLILDLNVVNIHALNICKDKTNFYKKIIYNKLSKNNFISNDNETVIYVDDDGGADYLKIQDAIDNSSKGDTIFVYNGTYFERIIINKTITLIAHDINTTIIDGYGNENVVTITSPTVYIANFTIQNITTNNYWVNAGIYVFSDNNSIVNNHINDIIDTGIFIANSSNNTIRNNFIERCGSGIDIWSLSKFGPVARKNIVENNKIIDSQFGIWVQESDENNLSNNYICRTLWEGIQLIGSRKNIICYNKISNSKYRSGIYLSQSNDNFIFYNNISKNRAEGITLERSSFNILYKNNIEKNRIGLLIYLFSIGNVILCNNFIENKIRNAFFRNSFFNRWINNYWDTWIGLKSKVFERFPKLIPGRFRILRPRINFDFCPAKKPFEI